jgi:hypothetical protein
MKRGRKSLFDNPVTLSLVVEKNLHDPILELGIRESEVYKKGARAIIKERIFDLSEDDFDKLIQIKREQMKKIQDEIAWLERMKMDVIIKNEHQTRKKKEIRFDERGREYQVVISE